MIQACSTHDWVFVATDRRLGSWKPHHSPNTFEDYEIKTTGTWVPMADLEWLVSQKKHCACANGAAIQLVSRIRATVENIKTKPKDSPRLRKQRSPDFGLFKVGG